MPKVFITSEKREESRFSDFIRGELKRRNLRQADLAAELELPTVSVTQRLNGKSRWTLPEIITALSFLNTSFTFGERK